MKIFLICPVRGHEMTETSKTVEALEADGNEVYWPPRDTDQVDPTGLRICEDNLRAIQQCDKVYFLWDGKSQGSLFDLGMAFALYKPLVIVELPPLTEGKSFQNMATKWAEK